MRRIEELPEHESFAREYRYLIHERRTDGSSFLKRGMKPDNPETVLICGQAEGKRATLLSRGAFLNGEWRISCKSGQHKSELYGVARNRDEALAATMDAAELVSGSLSAGAFGRGAERYQSMLEERLALIRRDDVEKATEATPIRQILPSSKRWRLRRHLFHSNPGQEVITLTEQNGRISWLTLIGNTRT